MCEAFRQHPEIFPRRRSRIARQRQPRGAISASSAAARTRPAGFVRRIHGDLHLGNIVLIGGRPVLFDAIEFSDIIATGDVFYDLAFLLMDLLERRLDAAANIVFNRYLAETRRVEDFDALAAMPFFLSTRAAIRAKVDRGARWSGERWRAEMRIAASARAYFDFAARAIAPPRPEFIAVGGLSGTGKSKLARMLAPDVDPMPGAVIVRSDVERKVLFGVGETEKLPADAYRKVPPLRVYATLADKARRIVAAGHSVIVDAVFARAAERAAIAETCEVRGISAAADCSSPPTRDPARPRRRPRARRLRRRRAVAQAQETL